MAEITTAMIKALRDATGAGILDCKKALTETHGDPEQATDLLRTQGLASAAKKAGRDTSEGLIGSYVHAGAKVAGIVEVNCETDFVANTDQFKALARDLAMQVVAENPLYVSREEVPAEASDREAAIYREQSLQEGKPEHIVDRIVSGRMDKYYGEICLLEQAFIKDSDLTIEDLLKDNIARLGENIRVNRFSRIAVGD
ncbi:MAG: translation elongation factor Ts [Caldilineaceae bacterium]|nr:translation elongation factor Ts [Caldilineaceae bacterium]